MQIIPWPFGPANCVAPYYRTCQHSVLVFACIKQDFAAVVVNLISGTALAGIHKSLPHPVTSFARLFHLSQGPSDTGQTHEEFLNLWIAVFIAGHFVEVT